MYDREVNEIIVTTRNILYVMKHAITNNYTLEVRKIYFSTNL